MTAESKPKMPPLPQVRFDPALLNDPSMPASFDALRVDGVKEHLLRYSGQMSPGCVIKRLQDPVWLDAWDTALSALSGSRIAFCGSELGTFALRALRHGARHALCIEAFPLDARITAGMVQKDCLTKWHARYGSEIQSWSEEERRTSFEAFAHDIDIASADQDQPWKHNCDSFVFPQIDHTLLGTGIVKAIRQAQSRQEMPLAQILPAKAAIFAMGIQWEYPGTDFRLEAINRLRWSMYPQVMDQCLDSWRACTEPLRCGQIDFANFAETTWELSLPATGGRVDAILYWFELDLGNKIISNAPDSALQCIRPAMQYTDPIEVSAGEMLHVRVHVRETRLHFQALPYAAQQRTHELLASEVHRLGHVCLDGAYRDALSKALAGREGSLVLDLDAGCGILSMMAAQAGAEMIVACEERPAMATAGREIIAANGLADKVILHGKDCRKMTMPGDLPRRADLVVFDRFDCSLIGEGILHFLAHAREHLLAENARYLPAAAKIRAMVIEYRLDRIWDIDANLLNPYLASPGMLQVDATKLAYRPLTEAFDVFTFDFATASPKPETREMRLQASEGTAGAVLFWFELRLDETVSISNDPTTGHGLYWKQGLQFLPEVRIDSETPLPLAVAHDGSHLAFHWVSNVLQKENFSKLPRLDPRWLAVSSELEQQTRGLLQHCAQNPGEYAKVAEIAMRFAVDPGNYGLNPTIAQRFASMFLNQG